MEFSFHLREEDYLEFNMFTIRNYRFYKRQQKIFQILFALTPLTLGLLIWLVEDNMRLTLADGISILVMGFLSWFFWNYGPKLYDQLIQINAKKILFREGKVNILGVKTLKFADDYIRQTGQYEETTIKYEMIMKVKEGKTAIYLYTAPAMAIIIPLGAFTGPDQKEDLVHWIETRCKGLAG